MVLILDLSFYLCHKKTLYQKTDRFCDETGRKRHSHRGSLQKSEFSDATFYNLKKIVVGLGVIQLRLLRQLEVKNQQFN